MKGTPHTDKVFDLLNQVMYSLQCYSTWFDNIDDIDIEKETTKLDLLFSTINELSNECIRCNITTDDIYYECWSICKDIEDLPTLAKRLKDKLERCLVDREEAVNDDYLYKAKCHLLGIRSLGYIIRDWEINNLLDFIVRLRYFAREWVHNIIEIIRELDNNTFNELLTEQEPQLENDIQSSKEMNLPYELDTEEARKYFAKALELGYMQKCNDGYKWQYGGDRGKIRLGYLCYKIYSTPRPISKLEQIFGVRKLSASISNAGIEAKRADVKKWRNEMDNNIFND